MTKIVINHGFGGFGLSKAAWARLRELGCETEWVFELQRDDPLLVQVVEELGGEAAHRGADGDELNELGVVEVPSDVEWEIHEYDGNEWVAEKHRTWR